MTNHSTLFTNLMKFVLGSGLKFHDIRTAATFGWALVGLLISETIHLNHWALFRPGATKVASKERQFSRWLHNDKIRPMLLYPQLVQHALQDWKGKELFLALDTTVVAYRFVIVRLALVYRGRAIPLGWIVCASRSAMGDHFKSCAGELASFASSRLPTIIDACQKLTQMTNKR
jgi:hypothetical protein